MDIKKVLEKARNVVVVGIKLRPSSRELLTWTLAKFTEPGDLVVALHVAPKQQTSLLSSGTNISGHIQKEVDAIFDSVIGVYYGFCRIKQIKLLSKVIRGSSSTRRTLVNEVKCYKAIRLILGASATPESAESSSWTFAKYCSAHLPTTCSVLVIQHGQVVFEEAGVLTSGVNLKGVTFSSQQIMRGDTAGQRLRNNTMRKNKVQTHVESGQNQCNHYLSSRSLDVSRYVVHPYKYVPPPAQGLQPCMVEVDKSSFMAATSASRAKCRVPNIETRSWNLSSNDSYRTKVCSTNDDRNETGQEKSFQPSILSDLRQGQEKHTNASAHHRGWPLVKTGWNPSEPFPLKISLGLRNFNQVCHDVQQPSKEGDCKSQTVTRGNRHTTSDIPQGWPLLHRSIAATALDTPSRPQKMSVVEWVLQLPERPKGVLEENAESFNNDDMYIVSATDNRQDNKNTSNQEAEQAEIVLETDSEETLYEKIKSLCRSRNCVVFHIADLEHATNNFSKDSMIGIGGCSQVYHGVLSDARAVAIKCFDTSAASLSENEFLTELQIVSSLHHHHIVELLGYCVDNQKRPLLVYNFASEGNLEEKLHQDDKAKLSWSIRYTVALGIGQALEYIHSLAQPVIHRDVKPSNILLQSDFTPQLTDFGLSVRASTSSTFLTCNDVVGTFGYLAPEYFMFGKVSDKTDVYSFGVVLLELVSGRHAIQKGESNGQQNLIMWARPLLEDESKHDQIVDSRLEKDYDVDQLKSMLIAASLCLQHSPHARPSMSKVMKVLAGESIDQERRQDSMCMDSDIVGLYGGYGIHNHLSLALCDLDDVLSSQADSDPNVHHTNPNKLIEEYLRGRYSRSMSFN